MRVTVDFTESEFNDALFAHLKPFFNGSSKRYRLWIEDIAADEDDDYFTEKDIQILTERAKSIQSGVGLISFTAEEFSRQFPEMD